MLSSLSLDQLQARGLLQRKRQYWIIESRLHHSLDLTLQEDRSRVRTPNAAHLLGTLRRLVVSLANATVNRARKRNPKTKFNTRRFQQYFRSATHGPNRLHSLISSKSPSLCDF